MIVIEYYTYCFSGNLRKVIHWETDWEGEGCLLPDDLCTNTGQQVVEFFQEKHPGMCVPPAKYPKCDAVE